MKNEQAYKPSSVLKLHTKLHAQPSIWVACRQRNSCDTTKAIGRAAHAESQAIQLRKKGWRFARLYLVLHQVGFT